MHNAPYQWRLVSTCLLLYVFVLQGFISAVGVGQSATNFTERLTWSKFELCTHSGGSPVPATPVKTPKGDTCCVICLATGVYLNCVPPSTAQCADVAITPTVWLSTTAQLIGRFVNKNAWPRGPPLLHDQGANRLLVAFG